MPETDLVCRLLLEKKNQRCVHFVRNTGCKKSDGSQFFVLNQLIFEADSIRDVVDDDQRSPRGSVFIHQRRGREVRGQAVPLLLVQVPVLNEPLEKLGWEDLRRPAAERFTSSSARQGFERLVPADN